MTRRRWTAALVAAWVMGPMLAATRPACCVTPSPVVEHACCKAPMASAERGCCKPQPPPKQEARSKESFVGTLAPVAAVLEIARAARLGDDNPGIVRRLGAAHRAPSPDDSPPDLPTLHHTLLI